MADNVTVQGVLVATQDVAGAHHQRITVKEGGVYAYDAGTATGTIDVPATAHLKRVSVIANSSSSTTVTIGGGDTITIPAGGTFDEQIPGQAVGADVVIGGGTPQAYYVSWIA